MSSAVFRGLARLARAPTPTPRPAALTPRAGYTVKAARSPVGTLETFIGLGTITVAMLVPAGFFLANIENFKKRD
ncbi:cytochrome c oxidase subunit 8B, mitochondrial-like [Hypanus sabinus]|uniref:cytochrome c oxidase subunit 8B, mitochondrial-like n=1 Tax=Hypanus sabinus TaxID=79690 RepID=UPI0028C3B687|nr:cytochrome c oxidase subunit 8B, mitochondrial-like [Hypanus sabinus]